MELKHLLISIAIFALLGLGLFYLGSLLSVVEAEMKKDAKPPVIVAELLQNVEKMGTQVQDAPKRQEEALNALPFSPN